MFYDTFDKNLAFSLSRQQMRETEMMLRTLAIRFSKNTAIERIPHSSRYWKMAKPSTTLRGPITDITISLIHFFNMAVGYNAELDILVYYDLGLTPIDLRWELRHDETIFLLRDLGERFNSETRFYLAPRKIWKFPVVTPAEDASINDYNPTDHPYESDTLVKIKKTIVDLTAFFGMAVGYTKELDILIYRDL